MPNARTSSHTLNFEVLVIFFLNRLPLCKPVKVTLKATKHVAYVDKLFKLPTYLYTFIKTSFVNLVLLPSLTEFVFNF
jgi:hypothetical protein